jgi:hypothetical protein
MLEDDAENMRHSKRIIDCPTKRLTFEDMEKRFQKPFLLNFKETIVWALRREL